MSLSNHQIKLHSCHPCCFSCALLCPSTPEERTSIEISSIPLERYRVLIDTFVEGFLWWEGRDRFPFDLVTLSIDDSKRHDIRRTKADENAQQIARRSVTRLEEGLENPEGSEWRRPLDQVERWRRKSS